MVAAEARACGLPIIAPDQVKAGAGLTYISGDSRSAAEAIVRFIGQRVELAQPKIAALRIAPQTHGLRHIPYENGEERCSCLTGFVRLLIWATRNNGHRKSD